MAKIDTGPARPKSSNARAREERRARRIASKFVDYLTFDNHGGADWYVDAVRKIRDKFGDDADLVADLLAATSPQVGVVRNFGLALDAYDRFKRGLPQKPWIHCHATNIERALRREELSGPKVRAFARALKGDVNAIVVDTWMLRAAGLGSAKRIQLASSFRVTRRAIELAAEWAQVTPSSAQAQIWCAYRAANWTAKTPQGDGIFPL